MAAKRTLVQTEKTEYARDTATMAVINTDAAAFWHIKLLAKKAAL